MKIKILSFCALVAVFALILSFSVATPAAPQPAGAKAVPAEAVQPKAEPAPAVPQDHPEIRHALDALRDAREHLDHASHDFGGHKVAALRAIDAAINQLNICMKYDR